MRILIGLATALVVAVLTQVGMFVAVPALQSGGTVSDRATGAFVMGALVLVVGAAFLVAIAFRTLRGGDAVALAATFVTVLVGTLPVGWLSLPYVDAWASCGVQPVVEDTVLTSGPGVYYLPGDRGYGAMPFATYVCAEDQVEQGYRRGSTDVVRTQPPVTPQPEPTPTSPPVSTRQPCYSGSGKCD